MARILIVDDEEAVLFAVTEMVRALHHEPLVARGGAAALGLLDRADLVITDYAMPEMDGLALLSAIRQHDDTIPVVLLTAHGSERIAVRSVRAGAYEYVTKPFDYEEMAGVIERALEVRALRSENRLLSAERALGRAIVGDSAPMRRLLDAVGRVAPKDITVLVRGETGTGKELIAALVHAQSRRASGPLVRFNCAAIPGELADAELFGHVRGAFTGASASRRGYFAQADGGTLVLDEIGELSPGVQAKLLRALQQGEIQPVGASRIEQVDVRVIACTNRDLAAEAEAGRFRADLYYRLAVVELLVPPLREHREDVPELAVEFARRYRRQFGTEEARLSPELLAALAAGDWPGNVRQLENMVARMVAMSTGGTIGVDALTVTLAPPPGTRPPPPVPEKLAEGPINLRLHLEAIERDLLVRVLAATEGNQSEAARRLSISRSSLIDRMKKYGINP
ncbi:MAG: sigma-54 dependent transcriptional regulator [Anaeromyxobacter sp.]